MTTYLKNSRCFVAFRIGFEAKAVGSTYEKWLVRRVLNPTHIQEEDGNYESMFLVHKSQRRADGLIEEFMSYYYGSKNGGPTFLFFCYFRLIISLDLLDVKAADHAWESSYCMGVSIDHHCQTFVVIIVVLFSALLSLMISRYCTQ